MPLSMSDPSKLFPLISFVVAITISYGPVDQMMVPVSQGKLEINRNTTRTIGLFG